MQQQAVALKRPPPPFFWVAKHIKTDVQINAKSKMSPLRKQKIFIKRVVLDEICIFGDSVMPEHQLIEKNVKFAKRNFFDFLCFRSGLKDTKLNRAFHMTCLFQGLKLILAKTNQSLVERLLEILMLEVVNTRLN